MKRPWSLVCFFAVLSAPPLATAAVRVTRTAVDRGRPSSNDHARPSDSGGRHAEPPVVIKMHRYNVPEPNVIHKDREILRDRSRINWPRRDGHGAMIQKSAASVVPQQHSAIVRNTTIIRDIQRQQRVEVVRNRYYWHETSGMRYCHYYDRGIHWYGFYHGPSFYWTRYYGNRWWWFDVGFDRWVYWANGYWWWPGPGGVAYVYMDNNYYPYDQGTVTVRKPEMQSPPDDKPAANAGQTWTSPDGKRMVQVYGAENEAFLYDKSTGQPVFLKYLGRGVEKVRFSGGKEGKPQQVLVDFDDGTFAFFNQDGEPLDAAGAAELPSPPPPGTPPNEVPVPPEQ